MKCTGFGKRAFDKIITYVKQYNKEDTCYRSYNNFFKDGGLIWKLCGTASRHLPSARKNLLQYDNIRRPKKYVTNASKYLRF